MTTIIGFENTQKNLCHFNSIIQCLLRIEELNTLVLSQPNSSCSNFLELYKELIGGLKEHNGDAPSQIDDNNVINIMPLWDALCRDFTIHQQYDQQDALEDLTLLFEKCETLNPPVFNRLFQGKQMTAIQCKFCNNLSKKFESFFVLNTPLSGDTLYSCFDGIQREEEIEGYSCARCKKRTRAIKVNKVTSWPQFLFLSLSRISFKNSLATKNLNKIHLEPVFQYYPFDQYRLIAVIDHIGSSHAFGHYVTYIKELGAWNFNFIQINDEQITRNVGLNSVECPYILLFHKL